MVRRETLVWCALFGKALVTTPCIIDRQCRDTYCVLLSCGYFLVTAAVCMTTVRWR